MLTIKHLYKYYGRFAALNDVNMHVDKGELFGFVGPNGAGKTTTMRICIGLLAADAGEVYIAGEEVLHNHTLLKEKIGYVPDFFGVYDDLTAIEYLEFFASTYGFRGEETTKMCEGLLELVNLKDKRDVNVDGLSRGMKQRLCLARALVHNPDLLFLDEPASGLDPRARFELKEILRNLTDMGKTIVISSHILPELAEMCTSVGIIDRGHIVLEGRIDDILHSAKNTNPLQITLGGGVDDAIRIMKEFPFVTQIRVQNNVLAVNLNGGEQEEQALLKALINNNIPVRGYTREEGSLENLFMNITGKGGKR